MSLCVWAVGSTSNTSNNLHVNVFPSISVVPSMTSQNVRWAKDLPQQIVPYWKNPNLNIPSSLYNEQQTEASGFM